MKKPSAPKTGIAPQTILNGEVHDWYRLRLGFSDHLVSSLIDEFDISRRQSVLDPFCGAGTTLVECMKRGINSYGVDANPSSCFAATVKTNWSLDRDHLLVLLDEIENSFESQTDCSDILRDPTYIYLTGGGFIKRGWIDAQPLLESIAIKRCILGLRTSRAYKDALLLALITEVVENSSNVKFGPELYCGPRKNVCDVLHGFAERVENMAFDLHALSNVPCGTATVTQGDARVIGKIFTRQKFSAVICSPPYPAEHDYTRNARLELAFLEQVTDRDSLRQIKRAMIRSHTKGIYKGDRDGIHVSCNARVTNLVSSLKIAITGKDYGFARLYPTVAREYFGGMRRHFRAIKNVLEQSARCAYVVGDQASYLGVHIRTADILGQIAEQVGFKVTSIRKWRTRWASVSTRPIDENILILEKA